MVDSIVIPADVAKWLQKAVDLRLKYVEKAQNKEMAALKAELSKTETKLEQLYNEGLERGFSAEFVNHNEKRYKKRIAELAQQIQVQQINPQAVRQKSIDILKLVCNMGPIYRKAPLAEKKPLLRHITSDYILDRHKIYPKYREPFNIFVEGNKKCLEIKGKIPKSSKHLIWGGRFNLNFHFDTFRSDTRRNIFQNNMIYYNTFSMWGDSSGANLSRGGRVFFFG